MMSRIGNTLVSYVRFVHPCRHGFCTRDFQHSYAARQLGPHLSAAAVTYALTIAIRLTQELHQLWTSTTRCVVQSARK